MALGCPRDAGRATFRGIGAEGDLLTGGSWSLGVDRCSRIRTDSPIVGAVDAEGAVYGSGNAGLWVSSACLC